MLLLMMVAVAVAGELVHGVALILRRSAEGERRRCRRLALVLLLLLQAADAAGVGGDGRRLGGAQSLVVDSVGTDDGTTGAVVGFLGRR